MLAAQTLSKLPSVSPADFPHSSEDFTQGLSFFRNWAKTYGPIFAAPVIRPNEVHVSTFEGIDAVHRACGSRPLHGIPVLCWSEYFKRSPRFSGKNVDFLVNHDGAEWERHRKPIAKKLLSPEESNTLADRCVRAVVEGLPGFIDRNLDTQRMMPVDRFAFPLAFEIIVDCLYGTRLGLLDQKTATRHPFIDKTIKMFQLSMPCMFNRSWDGGNPATPELQAWLHAMDDIYAESLKQMAGVRDSADTSSIFAFPRDNGNFSEDELNVNSLALLIADVDTT